MPPYAHAPGCDRNHWPHDGCNTGEYDPRDIAECCGVPLVDAVRYMVRQCMRYGRGELPRVGVRLST